MFVWLLKVVLLIILFIAIVGTLIYIASLWFVFLDEIVEKIIKKIVRGKEK